MLKIDFKNPEWKDVAKPYSEYGKLHGLILAREHELPTTNQLWIYDDINTSIDDSNLPGDEKFICRPDAPMGTGNALPRGKDLYPEDIGTFYKSIRNKVKDAVIVVLRNPSCEIYGKYVPRYQVDGAAMVVVSPQNRLDIEFVGKGFDVGELTRGKSVHTCISLPWEAVEENPLKIMWQNKMKVLGGRRDIKTEDYQIQRQERLAELKRLGEYSADIETSVPETPEALTPAMFQRIYNECILKTLMSDHPELKGDYGIMMNIYDTRIYVFEIWRPKRSSMNK